MLFKNFFFALSALSNIVESAPYIPRDGRLQQSRRRAVDYPVHPKDSSPRRALFQKRAVDYSIVPVNGGPVSATAHATTLVETETVTKPAHKKTVVTTHETTLPPITRTISYTSVITDEQPTETKVYTKVIFEERPEQTVFVTRTKDVISTITASLKTSPAPTTQVVIQTEPVTKAVTKVITKRKSKSKAPAWSSTISYDDGQWHTSYPPFPTNTFSTLSIDSSNPSGVRDEAFNPQGVANPTGSHQHLNQRKAAAPPFPTALSPRSEKAARHANRIPANWAPVPNSE